MTKSRFDGARCEYCHEPLTFERPPGLTVASGEQVDVMHAAPWCSAWQNPIMRERCIPRAILDECQKEAK